MAAIRPELLLQNTFRKDTKTRVCFLDKILGGTLYRVSKIVDDVGNLGHSVHIHTLTTTYAINLTFVST